MVAPMLICRNPDALGSRLAESLLFLDFVVLVAATFGTNYHALQGSIHYLARYIMLSGRSIAFCDCIRL